MKICVIQVVGMVAIISLILQGMWVSDEGEIKIWC